MTGHPRRLDERLIDDIARVAHEANRALCLTQGDSSQVPYDDAPDWQKNSARDGVRAIAEGRVTQPGQSHTNWLAEKERTGWKWGPVKDVEKKEHPSMQPFSELSLDEQAKDHLFVSTVQSLLRALT